MFGRALSRNERLSLAAILLIQMGCGGGGGSKSDGSGPGTGSKITLSGRFAATAAATSHGSPAMEAATALPVATVIIFDTGGHYSTAPVSNGAFSIPVDATAPVALIFAGAANNFLGYMTLGNGINSLPMTAMKNGVTSIDLQTLTATGNVFTPSHNPLGVELPLTAQEQSAFAQCNGLFAGIVQNPDLDGNGVIDLLEGKFYHTFVAYGVQAMRFNGALTPMVPANLALLYFNLTIMTNDASDSGPATVTGPAGSGLVNAACTVTVRNSQAYYSVYSNLGSSPTPIPVAGPYVFKTALGKTLTVNVPDQSAASSRIVVAVPTVTLNAGNLTKVDWVYRLVGNNTVLSPAAMIDSLMVQVDHPLGSRRYDSSNLPSNIMSLTFTNQTLPWDSATCLYMAYNDVFGNNYVVSFNNP